ncbi:Protein kinase-like domain protein [Akanthomyces lecanii RCEF 1005]|uniref:EKC/KEOPS complex subunit BUD32 n=1 Tax=Akanthomyces lecanii RCEF 1005 TaxID=1081108 RepID=A0A168L257_CORDF|nr:Protein kinase-like domain protein [Akanthomyces lecanii RCEF 1005]
MTYWYEYGDSARGQCVRIVDVPGTLSGDILRLRQQLPEKPGHFEVDGNDIRELDHCLPHPDFVGDDSENVSEVMASLPLLQVDAAKHFLKKPKYNSEIQNLKKCQNGAVPGHSASRNIIQLFGKSSNGELVFEKLRPSQATLALYSSLPIYKTWILQLLDCLECLHSFGIIHKDLRADNLLFSADASRLILCDLESRWGECQAPEASSDGGHEGSGWTAQSDIYDVGNCIRNMAYGNNPITPFIERPVPAPLQGIVDACQREKPQDRPSISELRLMVNNIVE